VEGAIEQRKTKPGKKGKAKRIQRPKQFNWEGGEKKEITEIFRDVRKRRGQVSQDLIPEGKRLGKGNGGALKKRSDRQLQERNQLENGQEREGKKVSSRERKT